MSLSDKSHLVEFSGEVDVPIMNTENNRLNRFYCIVKSEMGTGSGES